MSSAIAPSEFATDDHQVDAEEISLQMPVETPECVRMTFRIAGPASRLGAYLIDTALRAGIVLGMGMLLSYAGIIPWGLMLVIWFGIEWFYFAFCEAMFDGRTVGKHVMGLRTIQKYGYPVSWWSALTRNFLRAADWWIFYGVALVSMMVTRRCQRLGDLVAGTVVIHESPVRLPTEPAILDTIQKIPREQYNSYVPPERTLALIDQLLSRRTNSRERIPHERGHELARELALTLSEKLGYSGDRDQVERYSMAFLARVYVTFQREDDVETDRSTSPLPFGVEGATR